MVTQTTEERRGGGRIVANLHDLFIMSRYSRTQENEVGPDDVETGVTNTGSTKEKAMSMKSRIIAAVGGVGLTLAVAVTAVTAGGPLRGAAAPSASPSSTPVASSSPATTTTTIVGPGAGFAF